MMLQCVGIHFGAFRSFFLNLLKLRGCQLQVCWAIIQNTVALVVFKKSYKLSYINGEDRCSSPGDFLLCDDILGMRSLRNIDRFTDILRCILKL